MLIRLSSLSLCSLLLVVGVVFGTPLAIAVIVNYCYCSVAEILTAVITLCVVISKTVITNTNFVIVPVVGGIKIVTEIPLFAVVAVFELA